MLSPTTIFFLALTAPLSIALPSPQIEDITIGLVTAKYDDIPANPLLNTGMITQPPNPYKGLCYQNFGVGNYSLNLVGFMPQSRPNALYSAPEETLLEPALISTTGCDAGGTFTAFSIYVACAVPTLTGDVATVPNACDLEFMGTKRNGRVVTKQAKYTPPALLNGAMQKVTFSGFDSLTSLRVATTGLSKLTAVVFLDDFYYLKSPL